jgi:hypothetical protein
LLEFGAWSPITVACVIGLAGFVLEEATGGQDVNKSFLAGPIGSKK